MGRTLGGLHTLNGRGFMAHTLEAKLSPLAWAYFAFDPRRDVLDLEPGDWVTWGEGAGHGWIANFQPMGEGAFRVRVLVMPPHLNIEAVTQACGEPLRLDGLAQLPPAPETASGRTDPREGVGRLEDL